MSLVYSNHKWKIDYYWLSGRYGSRARFALQPEIQDREIALMFHDSFIKKWKACRLKKARNYRLERQYRLAFTPEDAAMTRNEKQYAKAKKDPAFVISNRIHSNMSQAIRRHNADPKKGRNWEAIVGYTLADLKKNIEKHFLPGMTWENIEKWHIDHTVPISAFNYKTVNDIDFKRCWALRNLRPMWKRDNLSKAAKIERPFQPSLSLTV